MVNLGQRTGRSIKSRGRVSKPGADGRLRFCLLLSVVCLPVPGWAQQSQQPPPTISVNVKVVNVLAIVRTKHGEIVRNLTKDDFVLQEDDRPQTIGYFARETDLPLTPRSAGGYQHEPKARTRPGA